VLSERRTTAPYGLMGGLAGNPGVNTIIRNGTPINKPSKFHEYLAPMDEIRIETPGGGGYGKEEADG